jgi:hypothetical protein
MSCGLLECAEGFGNECALANRVAHHSPGAAAVELMQAPESRIGVIHELGRAASAIRIVRACEDYSE